MCNDRENEGFSFWRLATVPVALAIWIADMLCSIAIGFAVVGVIWCLASLFGDFAFGRSWKIAGAIVGMMFVGLWDGCDIPLNWLIRYLPGHQK